MDLIDRYLAAVRMLLPREARDDIAAELRDILMNRREEKEASLGRPLTKAEDEALLKEFGNPLLVAGRYGRQQYLIGPELYPIYLLVLKIVLAVIVGSALITGIVNAAVTPDQIGRAVGTAVGVVWTGSFAAIGAVTAVFAVLQRTPAGAKLLDAWRPSELPRTPSPRIRRGEQWYNHLFGIAAQVIFILWWTGAVHFGWQPFVAARPGQSLDFTPAPIWQTLYWPILALAGFGISVEAMKLAGWAKRAPTRVLEIVRNAAMIGIAGFALRAGRWAIVAGAGLPARSIAEVDRGVNIGAQATLTILIVIAAITLVWEAWRLARPER